MSRTFQEQASLFLQEAVSRARKPLKPASVHGFESYLRKWVNPQLGVLPLSEVNNKTVKVLVAKMLQAQLSAKSIDNVVGLIKLVVSSDLDENGEPRHIRKWNSAFLDMPVVRNQHRPKLTPDVVEKLAKCPKLGMLYTLLASTGLRIGEALGLETRHVQGRTLVIQQSCWYGVIQTPKTFNAFRNIDLTPAVADMLQKFIGGRRFGLVFGNGAGNPHSQTNLLRRSLHPLLQEAGCDKMGFHALRRFRVTWLRKQRCSEDLLRYWLGHASRTVTDEYVMLKEDLDFRLEVAEKVGVGFSLPA
jgi:integrase